MKKAIFSIFALLTVFAMVMTSCDTGGNPNSGDGTEYTVSFNTNGGQPPTIDEQKVKSGNKATEPDAPTKTNNNFVGWYKEAELTTPWNFDTDTVKADITLYAKWTPKAGYFIVTFDSNGGSNVSSQTVANNGKARSPNNPTKADNNFAGWYKETELTTPWDFTIDTVTADITLYARWVTGIVSTLSSVTANGSSLFTTSKLTLSFDKAITGLTADDITLTGVAGVIKGDLTSDGSVYTLPISGFTAGGDLVVKVEKADVTIIGPTKTVKIHVATNDSAGIKDLVLSSSGVIEIDTETGIISRDISSDYGNAFGVKIPEEYLPIIASDTIKVTYIGDVDAPLTTKANSDLVDLVPVDYDTFNGGYIEQEKTLRAVDYGANLPTEYLWFQGRPNTAAWQLKILSITVEHGDPINVTAGITGIKPVAGQTPVTTLGLPGYLQYTGTITWSSNPTTFTAGTAYTATITLTKNAGYTFERIEANKFPVAGAVNVTNDAGTEDAETLKVTAEFPPAAATAAPDKILTFAEGDVKGTNSNVTILTNGTGYRAVTTAGYGSAWTYFKVTFDPGLTLSDYTKISYSVKGIDGGTGTDNTGYKEGVMGVFASEDKVASPGPSNSAFTETTSWQETGVGALGESNENNHTVTVKVQPGTDLNEVWIAFRVGGTAGWTYELSDIKFFNP